MVSVATYTDFLDEYINKVPLTGQSFLTNIGEVHTYLVKFTAGNVVAEAKIQPCVSINDCKQAFLSLKEHYEGVGINPLDVVKADKT